jgi:hypothetical protein
MPDRYDPKLSVRPPGERKTAEASSDSDPLAELARLVSGRVPFDAPPAARGKAVAAPPAPEPDVERDLEAELLNDLQASFAAIREPLENASTVVSASDPPPEPAPLPQPPLRAAAEPSPSRVPEPKPEPPRRPEAMTFDISQAFEESEFAPAPRAASRPQPAKSYINPMRGPAAPQNRGDLPARVAPPPRPTPAARPEQAPVGRGEPVQPRLERPASPQPGPDKSSLLRRVVGPPRTERPNLPVRPLPGNEEPRATEPAAPPRASAPKPGRTEPAPLPSRFAPPKGAIPLPPPRRQPAPEPVVEPPAEDDFELADLAGELEGPFEDEFTLDDLDAAAYGPDDEFPPFPEEELASLKRRRSGRVFAVVAGMLAIVAIGGAAVFLYRSDAGTGSPPPIIAADSGPNKVPPDEPAATETDAQGKLIYDRVDEAGDGSERLVTSGDAEIGTIPADDADVANNPITRVIIPGGPGIDSPVSGDGAGEAVIADTDAAAPDTPAGEESDIGPRMVRTVVVKPDGTIVSSEATGVDEDGNALPQPEESDVAVSIPDPTRTQMDAVLEGGDLEVNPDPLSQPEPVEEPTAAAETPAASEPIPEPPAEPEVAPAMRTLPSPQPVATVQPSAVIAKPEAPSPAGQEQRQEQTIVATRDSADGPIDLTPGTAPAAGAVQTGGGGVLVQVTAVRSEGEAVSAYRGLQQRYPSILGAFQPTIVRADLGDRGIYYRVRVGPFSGGDAARLCEDLKAAGADCMIAR